MTLRAALVVITVMVVGVGVLLGVMFGPGTGLIGAACAIVIGAISSLAVIVPRRGPPRDKP